MAYSYSSTHGVPSYLSQHVKTGSPGMRFSDFVLILAQINHRETVLVTTLRRQKNRVHAQPWGMLSSYACMHVCVYMCVYIYIYMHKYIYIHPCTHIHTHSHASANIGMVQQNIQLQGPSPRAPGNSTMTYAHVYMCTDKYNLGMIWVADYGFMSATKSQRPSPSAHENSSLTHAHMNRQT
jgi:hypothetical protein